MTIRIRKIHPCGCQRNSIQNSNEIKNEWSNGRNVFARHGSNFTWTTSVKWKVWNTFYIVIQNGVGQKLLDHQIKKMLHMVDWNFFPLHLSLSLSIFLFNLEFITIYGFYASFAQFSMDLTTLFFCELFQLVRSLRLISVSIKRFYWCGNNLCIKFRHELTNRLSSYSFHQFAANSKEKANKISFSGIEYLFFLASIKPIYHFVRRRFTTFLINQAVNSISLIPTAKYIYWFSSIDLF